MALRDIAEEHFGDFLRYERGFRSYKGLILEQRSWATETVVVWGPSGTGKSKFAWEQGGPDAYWLARPNSIRCFWDGYDGHETVVIDEFYGWLPYTFMLRLLDRYPLRVETKGGSVPFVAKKVIITSNLCPVKWYKEGLRSLRRRLQAPIGIVYHAERLGAEFLPYELPPDNYFGPEFRRPNGGYF